jgi:hypothetical protein
MAGVPCDSEQPKCYDRLPSKVYCSCRRSHWRYSAVCIWLCAMETCLGARIILGGQVDLTSARAKLQRARLHRNDLEAKIAATFDTPDNWARLSAELDPKSRYHIFRITDFPAYDDIVEEISLRVGDIVHGLRCALDHLSWQLANTHGPMTVVQERRIMFPIHTTAVKFQNDRTATCYDQRDWAQMEGYQPFQGINGRPDSWSGPYVHPLEHLQKLSNTDKHRQLSVVMLTSSHFTTIQVEGGYPPWFVKKNGEWTVDHSRIGEPNPYAAPPNFDHTSYIVEKGAEVVRFKITSEFAQQQSIGVAGAVMPSVALGDKRPILPTLDRLAAFVALILDEFIAQLRKDGRLRR